MNDFEAAVLSGIIVNLATAAPVAVASWVVSRRLDGLAAPVHPPASSHATSMQSSSGQPVTPEQQFILIEARISTNINTGGNNNAGKDTPIELVLAVAVLTILAGAILAQHQWLVIGGLAGATISILLALWPTLRRNHIWRGRWGHNGAWTFTTALACAIVPIVSIGALHALRLHELTFWDLGSRLRASQTPAPAVQDPLQMFTSFFVGTFNGVAQLVDTHGLPALVFLLLCTMALLAPILALTRAAWALIDWNFYLGFIAGSQGKLRRRAAGRFNEFGFRQAAEIVGTSAALLLIVAVGGLLLGLEPTMSN